MPFFSVIIPTYNRAEYIVKTIKSILSQSFQDFEIIIIDDASTDQTEDNLKSFDDNRIIYIKNSSNKERCVSRNTGIEHSKGRYICFLDSDDLYLPDHLEIIYKEIVRQNFITALFFTNAFDQNNDKVVTDRYCPDLEICSIAEYILTYTFNPARVCISASILKEEKFDPAIPGLEDLELWLRISLRFPICQIKQRTIIYNLHAESYTMGDSMRYEKELKYFKYIFDKKIFKGKLPSKSKNRLLSMCHYHLAIKAVHDQKKIAFYSHALRSFYLYPKGYNGKTNKTLLVTSLYSLPLVGQLLELLVKFFKSYSYH